MSIFKVYEFPNPILKKVCSAVTSFDRELDSCVINLLETMYSYKFCVGLAAPQVGYLQRIIVIDVSKARKPQSNQGLLVLVNPEIIEASDFKIVREGCLSIPDFTANVNRAMKITVKYQNVKGEIFKLESAGLEAHAIGHEVDHLDGILFLDRMINPARDLFKRKMR